MNRRILRLAAATGLAAMATGCAVYPVPYGAYEPQVVYPAAAPVVVAPAAVYPSVTINGRFGGGRGYYGRGHGGRGYPYWRR